MAAPHIPDPSSGATLVQTPKDFSRWHSKRKLLHNLYINQGKSLNDVKTIMEKEHGFPKTFKHSDYEYVLREEFKYRKNLSSDEWRLSIGPRIARRKAEGKRSEVFLNGSKVQNVDRRIRRSFQSKHAHRRAKAPTAVLPYGVVIRTPSPQPSNPVESSTSSRDPGFNKIEEHERHHSYLEPSANSLAQPHLLSLLTGHTSRSDAGSGATVVLSAQLLREGCPINKLLFMLDEYQRQSNHAELRLFGPNATVSILGKMCFDFSNNLQEKTMSRHEMESILDWIGFSVDTAILTTFFAQKAFTILAVWEALTSTVLSRTHLAAFDVLVSAHLSIRDQAPWTISKPYNVLADCLEMGPDCVKALMNAYSCDQWELDQALEAAVSNEGQTELAKPLISAGASFRNENCRTSADISIVHHSRREEAIDLTLLKIILEAGAIIDKPTLFGNDYRNSWHAPGYPECASDYLLLSAGYSARIHDLWSLMYLYSDRQRTTVTVPGIFQAAEGGQEQLHSYLNSRFKPYDDRDRMMALEIALSEASGRRLASVVQVLVEFGVDPNVRLLLEVPFCGFLSKDPWHPIVRAVNTGDLDTLQVLLGVSSIDLALLNERVGSQFDLCSLRNMENSQRYQILRVLSNLDLSTAARSEILSYAIQTPRTVCCSSHKGPDFGFVSQLLDLGLARLDCREHLKRETSHILVRAIKMRCDVKVLEYLVQRDVEVLSTLSEEIIGSLLEATIKLNDQRNEILGFLAQNVEGLQSYVQEYGSPLLSCLLKHMLCNVWNEDWPERDHWESRCEAMITLKWLLDLGIPLHGPNLTALLPHADDSFMLAMIHSMTEVNAEDNRNALQLSIRLGRLNLAAALIERGVDVNESHVWKDGLSPLQRACEEAPLWFIRFLVEAGADVNALPSSDQGITALQAACATGAELSCISFLVDKGADVNAPPALKDGFTALQCAASEGLMNVAGFLLDHGADVNALSGAIIWDPCFVFIRAIDLAAVQSRLDMVHFLIAAGARSCQPGSTGFDGAIDIATCRGNVAIARLLQEHAESCSEDPMEAERIWLQKNPHACMYEGSIQFASWVDYVKKVGEDGKPCVYDYIEQVHSRH